MREVVIGLSSKLGLSVREEPFSPFTLQQSDEVWLTNALHGVSAVRQFRKTEFACAKAELMQALVQERAQMAQFQ
jgi:branched-subunit amino acid aminotransferase/4-amino-4-deoxychorismate lyase